MVRLLNAWSRFASEMTEVVYRAYNQVEYAIFVFLNLINLLFTDLNVLLLVMAIAFLAMVSIW